jgi:hypothetical protein
MLVHHEAIYQIAKIAAETVGGVFIDYTGMIAVVSADPVKYENAYHFWEFAWRMGFPHAYIAGGLLYIAHPTGTYRWYTGGFIRDMPISTRRRKPVGLNVLLSGDHPQRAAFIQRYYALWYRSFAKKLRDAFGG